MAGTTQKSSSGQKSKAVRVTPDSDDPKDQACQVPEANNTSIDSENKILPEGGCASMLEVLYDVAESINITRDVNEVLMRFLHTLTDIVGARAGAVRLRYGDGQMHLVASVGISEEVLEHERIVPEADCTCSEVGGSEGIFFQESLRACDRRAGVSLFADENISMIVVPLRHRQHELGVYNLYVDSDNFNDYRQYEEMFTCIGRYLGMAIEKARLDDEANRLSIMDERTRLANELHDSLAQTLASLRFQVRVMDETLHEGDEASLWGVLEKIENSLDEANAELRELITHFRAPLHKQGVIAGVERAIDRFRRHCDIPIFFQGDWPQRKLPAEFELQIIRIVQESLANIRKHSQAKTVRVLLQGRENGDYRVLIEDDGVGFPTRMGEEGQAGDHIGLNIMRDRARRIRGELIIESDPKEGTRVILRFRAPALMTSGVAINGKA
jgi:two-component system nitrate/nitrite sensor histidine kinase NarX